MNKLKVVSLFSGIGAFEKALKNQNINYELVNYCEFDKYAAKSYSLIHNESEDLNLGDITKVDETKLSSYNLQTWGSPCQDFSISGKQEGAKWVCNDCKHEYNPLYVHYSERDKCPKCGCKEINKTRSSLLVEGLRILRQNKPEYSVYENVKNITGKNHKETFELFLKELEEYGYNNYYKVLNAKDYGIPQNRERVFVISIRKDVDDGKFEFPKPFDNGLRLKDLLEAEVDEKYYKIKPSVQKNLNLLYPYILNCQKDIFVPTQSQVSSGRQDNLVGINITPCLRVNGYTLVLDKTKRVRKLTPKEYWRLMGIPDEIYKKVKDSGLSDTQLYKMAGNSIVVNVLEEIFKKLFNT